MKELREAIERHPAYISGDDDLSDKGLLETAAKILDRIAEDKPVEASVQQGPTRQQIIAVHSQMSEWRRRLRGDTRRDTRRAQNRGYR